MSLFHIGGIAFSSGSPRKASFNISSFFIDQLLRTSLPAQGQLEGSEAYLSRPRTLQFWTSAMVVLPVFLQAPWVRLQPFSACLFTFVLLGLGICLVHFGREKWAQAGSLLVGVSGSWLGGCLFWGWLRVHPIWHLPVEAIALPCAFVGLSTRWRVGAGFYLACLLGTACTDLMMLLTGVMDRWPEVVQADLNQAPDLLNKAASQLFQPQPIAFLLVAGVLIALLANEMRERACLTSPSGSTWLVASAALTTTLWIDGLFLITALIQPRLSGLI